MSTTTAQTVSLNNNQKQRQRSTITNTTSRSSLVSSHYGSVSMDSASFVEIGDNDQSKGPLPEVHALHSTKKESLCRDASSTSRSQPFLRSLMKHARRRKPQSEAQLHEQVKKHHRHRDLLLVRKILCYQASEGESISIKKLIKNIRSRGQSYGSKKEGWGLEKQKEPSIESVESTKIEQRLPSSQERLDESFQSTTSHPSISSLEVLQPTQLRENDPVKLKTAEEEMYKHHLQAYLRDVMGEFECYEDLDFLYDDFDEFDMDYNELEMEDTKDFPEENHDKILIFEICITNCSDDCLDEDDFSEITLP